MTDETLKRSEADRRIRRTATAASWLCAVVAAASLLMTVVSLWLAADMTRAGMVEDGRDLVAAFFTTSSVCGNMTWVGGAPPYQVAGAVGSVLSLAGRAVSGVIASQLAVDAAFIPEGTVIIDTGALAIGVLLLAVCRMFEYGCILQQQDDELL